jgi:hypothetical protein
MPDLTRIAGVRCIGVTWLPPDVAALYRDQPARVAKNLDWFARHELRDRRAALVEEVGHHLTGATYRWNVSPEERRRCEGRAWRAGARWWADDAAVERALAAGCRQPWEFAERWEMREDWARRRLSDYLVQHPQAAGRWD